MIQIRYEAVFNLNEALTPLNALADAQENEPKWYWHQRMNILRGMEQDLQDEIEMCDDRISEVVFNHANWAAASFTTDDTSLIRGEAEELERKIQTCIDNMVAEYPVRLKKYHDDLIADGEEIPVDVYQP